MSDVEQDMKPDMLPFPIQDGPTVPWYVMAPHESQCQKNHSQSLKEIARRGGFSCAEAYAVTHGLAWRELRGDYDGFRKKWFEYAEKINIPAPEVGLRDLLARIKGLSESLDRSGHHVVAKEVQDLRSGLPLPSPPRR